MTPKRIQLSRKKGFRLPPNTAVVSRPTQWGNPFHIDDFLEVFDGLEDAKAQAQETAVAAFQKMVKEGNTPPFNLWNIRELLRGKNLACWCKLGHPCHADVLLKIANSK